MTSCCKRAAGWRREGVFSFTLLFFFVSPARVHLRKNFTDSSKNSTGQRVKKINSCISWLDTAKLFCFILFCNCSDRVALKHFENVRNLLL